MNAAVLNAARPLFRYSVSRDAYILRGIGQRRGPVLVPKSDARFSKDDEKRLVNDDAAV